jgi:D-alanyl-D-alanine carboxypeptidase
VSRALQQALDGAYREAGVPEVSAAVVLPDGTLWAGVDGRAEIGTARAVTPRTVFAAASATKTYLAALVLKPAEQGKLSLDDRLVRWVPTFPRSRKITVRQLLNHTAGTKEFVDSPALQTAGARFAGAIRRHEHPSWTPEKTLSFVRQRRRAGSGVALLEHRSPGPQEGSPPHRADSRAPPTPSSAIVCSPPRRWHT